MGFSGKVVELLMSVPLGELALATPFGFPFRAPKEIARWIKFNGGETKPHIVVLNP